MSQLRQDVGVETVWKKRSHTRNGLVRFFKPSMPDKLMQLAHFNFGFRI